MVKDISTTDTTKPTKTTSPLKSKQVVAKQKTPVVAKQEITRLSLSDQAAIRAELWHIVRVALLILALYGGLAVGFHIWHWDQKLSNRIHIIKQ